MLVLLPPAGHLYPMEGHLVSLVSQAVLPACPKQGCVVVTGVLFELSDDLTTGSDWLEPLFAAMPLNEGVSQLYMAHALHGQLLCSCPALVCVCGGIGRCKLKAFARPWPAFT